MENSNIARAEVFEGVTFKKFITWCAITLAFLLAVLSVALAFTNVYGSRMSKAQRGYTEQMNIAEGLQKGADALSENAGNYILMPQTGKGEANVTPLSAYLKELKVESRLPENAIKAIKKSGAGKDVVKKMTAAAEGAEKMLEKQKHALALMVNKYEIPGEIVPDGVFEYFLTDEEKTLSPDAARRSAIALLYGDDYAADKRAVAENTAAVIAAVREDIVSVSLKMQQKIKVSNVITWISLGFTIVCLAVTFGVIFVRVVPMIEGAPAPRGNSKQEEENAQE